MEHQAGKRNKAPASSTAPEGISRRRSDGERRTDRGGSNREHKREHSRPRNSSENRRMLRAEERPRAERPARHGRGGAEGGARPGRAVEGGRSGASSRPHSRPNKRREHSLRRTYEETREQQNAEELMLMAPSELAVQTTVLSNTALVYSDREGGLVRAAALREEVQLSCLPGEAADAGTAAQGRSAKNARGEEGTATDTASSAGKGGATAGPARNRENRRMPRAVDERKVQERERPGSRRGGESGSEERKGRGAERSGRSEERRPREKKRKSFLEMDTAELRQANQELEEEILRAISSLSQVSI